MVCDTGPNGLGDQIERYAHCLRVARALNASVELLEGAFGSYPSEHSGSTEYKSVARLLGIPLDRVGPPAGKSVGLDEAVEMGWLPCGERVAAPIYRRARVPKSPKISPNLQRSPRISTADAC